MLKQLEQIAISLRDDAASRVIILNAVGDNFSFGADLNVKREQPLSDVPLVERRRMTEQGARMMRAIQEIHQPTICALRGVATGGGACIATACDFRIGDDTCRVGYGEVRLGMNLMWQALPTCVHLVGPARAKRMVMTGKLFDAETLLEWGFLDEVVKPDVLGAAAEGWAAELAALPPVAVQMIKRSVNAISSALDSSIMHMDADQWLLATESEDFQEGLTAFAEKRPPSFTGN
jgi:enoyl-CoA hydratase/carnithine racemase